MHLARDRDGRRLSIKEALRGEAAIQGKHVTRASHNISSEEMITELDKIFMPKQESSLARQKFHDYKQHPDEPALANKLLLFDKGWPGETNRKNLLVITQEDLCSRPMKRDLRGRPSRTAWPWKPVWTGSAAPLRTTRPHRAPGWPRGPRWPPLTLSNQPGHRNLPGPMATGGHSQLLRIHGLVDTGNTVPGFADPRI